MNSVMSAGAGLALAMGPVSTKLVPMLLQEGARPLIEFYKTLPDRMTEFRAAARAITGKVLLASTTKVGRSCPRTPWW